MFRKLSMAAMLLIAVSNLTAVAAGQDTSESPATPALVDINTAPVEQIQEIVMDEELAARIVEGRPYANKRQLLSRDLVTAERYEEIKDRIVARRVEPSQ